MNLNCREVEIEITTKCNNKCFDCNHMCSDYQAPDDLEITTEQLERFFEDTKNRWDKVCIMGGEPLLHSKFLDIIKIASNCKKKYNISQIIVSTNMLPSDFLKELEGAYNIFICHGVRPENYFQKNFIPINIAPIDLKYYNGSIDCQWQYGYGLNAYGLYNCSPAGAIDRVLGMDLGIKDFCNIDKISLANQTISFCKYCGLLIAKKGYNIKKEKFLIEKRTEPIVTNSWSKFFGQYKIHKPTLTKF